MIASTSQTFFFTSELLSFIKWTKLGISTYTLSFYNYLMNLVSDLTAISLTSFSLSLNNYENMPIKFISDISLENASTKEGKFCANACLIFQLLSSID